MLEGCRLIYGGAGKGSVRALLQAGIGSLFLASYTRSAETLESMREALRRGFRYTALGNLSWAVL